MIRNILASFSAVLAEFSLVVLYILCNTAVLVCKVKFNLDALILVDIDCIMIYACGEIISGSVLAQELNTQGLRSVFLTGGQAGIETDDHYSEANILTVHTDRLKKWLAQDYIIIVAGGQGMTASGDITATGRGGSDTTACAIGYYTGADEVRIYTDVDGIYIYGEA